MTKVSAVISITLVNIYQANLNQTAHGSFFYTAYAYTQAVVLRFR